MDNNCKIIAILSDYDGTLCPTSHIDLQDNNSGFVPGELEDILVDVSSTIPICIISSKDFYFLYKRVRKFSKIISCMLGIETLFLNDARKTNDKDRKVTNADNSKPQIDSLDIEIDKLSTFRHLLIDNETIIENSIILKEISSFLEINFPFINVEKKFSTIAKDVVGGITIDWRNDKSEDWVSNAKKYKKIVKESMYNAFKKAKLVKKESNKNFEYYLKKFFIQEYATHPFIDIYGTKTSKGDAYDCVVSELFNLNNGIGKVLYLGDSENDNPAFRKADISIGINSDTRLRPDLTSKYRLDYQDLPNFLRKLSQNNFEFQESLLNAN
ncbi:HAD hydrolase family protein [Candidatus Nitrosocosmicus sp. T]